MSFLSRLIGGQSQASPRVVGHALFMLVLKSDLSEAVQSARQIDSLVRSRSPEEELAFLSEMYLLRLFAVDWGVFQVLGDTSAKNAVLDEFWGEHRKMLVVDPSYVEKTSALDDRMLIYTLAVRDNAHSVFLSVGKAFAASCGHANDPLFFHPGTVVFRDTVVSVSQVLYESKMSTKVFTAS